MATSSIESVGVKTNETQRPRGRFSTKLRAGGIAFLLTFGAATVAGVTTEGHSPERRVETSLPTPTPDAKHAAMLTPDDLPEVQAVQAESAMKDLDAYFKAKAVEDYFNTQKALGDYVVALQANDAARAAEVATVQQPSQPQSVYSDSDPGGFLSCVRNRESGGNYGIYNSGGSGAAGAYQFMPGTWNSIAESSGRGDLVGMDPAQAAPADQDSMAQALYAQQGAAPWGGGC